MDEEEQKPHPSDPISPLVEGATSMHELMLAYVEGGFTPRQAFEIVKDMAVAMMMKGGGQQ